MIWRNSALLYLIYDHNKHNLIFLQDLLCQKIVALLRFTLCVLCSMFPGKDCLKIQRLFTLKTWFFSLQNVSHCCNKQFCDSKMFYATYNTNFVTSLTAFIFAELFHNEYFLCLWILPRLFCLEIIIKSWILWLFPYGGAPSRLPLRDSRRRIHKGILVVDISLILWIWTETHWF